MELSLTNNAILESPEPASLAVYQEFLNGLPVKKPDRILFINIPQVPADIFNPFSAKMKGYHIYPPIGYLYLAAAARLADPALEFTVLDLNYEMLKRCHLGQLERMDDFWKDLIEEEVGRGDRLHVCVGNMFEATTPMFQDITRFLRQSFPGVTVISGGVQTSLDWKEVLEGDYSHIVFRNEPEMEFKMFLETCAEKKSRVPGGIAFRLEDGIHEGAREFEQVSEFLDIRPYFSLVDYENYYKYGGVNPYSRYVGKEKPFGTVLANRGCRARCTFCGVRGFNGVGVRRRSARSIVDEIRFLMEEKGVKVIEWLDDDLLYGRRPSEELFRTMAEELPGLEWIANNGVIASAVSEEIMYWMVKSGCKAFKVGIESGNKEILRQIKKPTSPNSLMKASAIFKKYPGVFVSGNFIVGFPKENFGEMMDSFNLAAELDWDWANYYICQPLPGTDVFDAFASLGDDRCGKDNYGVYNPGKAFAQKGNFGYYKGYHTDEGESEIILSGREVFELPYDQVPSAEQIKEIWFTFNMVSNFLNNRNWKPGGNIQKMVQWFESIVSSYPNDAGMCAMLAHGYRELGDSKRCQHYRTRFHALVTEYDYWKRRAEEFPELSAYADGLPMTDGRVEGSSANVCATS